QHRHVSTQATGWARGVSERAAARRADIAGPIESRLPAARRTPGRARIEGRRDVYAVRGRSDVLVPRAAEPGTPPFHVVGQPDHRAGGLRREPTEAQGVAPSRAAPSDGAPHKFRPFG